jgi:hypothetical protein
MKCVALRIVQPFLCRIVILTAMLASFGCGEVGDGPSAPNRPSTEPPATENLVGKSPPGLVRKPVKTRFGGAVGGGGGGIKGNATNSSQ